MYAKASFEEGDDLAASTEGYQCHTFDSLIM